MRRVDGDTGVARSYHHVMPYWHCPHCGTPQPEAARCWVCRRSSTTCGTCRNYRRGVAGQLGYCGLDRRRVALQGDEIRGCWEGVTDVAVPPARPVTTLVRATTTRTWTEVGAGAEVAPASETSSSAEQPGRAATGADATLPAPIIDPPPPRLWSDAEV